MSIKPFYYKISMRLNKEHNFIKSRIIFQRIELNGYIVGLKHLKPEIEMKVFDYDSKKEVLSFDKNSTIFQLEGYKNKPIQFKLEYLNNKNEWLEYKDIKPNGKQFLYGVISALKETYPCPKLRIIKLSTNEVVDEIRGNGEVKLN